MAYNNNLKTLEANVQKLEATEDTFQQQIRESDPTAVQMWHKFVQNWQEEVKKVIPDARRLIETQEDKWCLGTCPNLMLKLNDMKNKVKDPNTKMIGVHGIDGDGQKTLVTELAIWQLKNIRD
ncbi:hypothetical protein Fmac_018804 [Flemingia macrophylla]|uniref:Uncharacterized protein n=1 Tax=Flemingia macrophylla TaxID=520843 RepID=A0ABD1M613_9FABA